jgi:uncharacterized protein YxeA
MKKLMACILYAILSQSAYINVTAYADTVSPSFQPKTDSRKSYLKHQKKEQKRARTAEKRAEKRWRKDHGAGRR